MTRPRDRLASARDRVRERAAWVRDRASALRREVRVLAAALRDPRTPWYARAVAGLTVGLAVSPIDPIPDFLPVLGYLDDLVLVPLGAYLARRAIPDAVLADARERADEAAAADEDGTDALGWLVALLVLLGWAVALYLLVSVALPRFGVG